jgi:hypothetical protein
MSFVKVLAGAADDVIAASLSVVTWTWAPLKAVGSRVLWGTCRSSSSGGLARVQQRMEKLNDSDRMRGVNQATAGCERVERIELQRRLEVRLG